MYSKIQKYTPTKNHNVFENSKIRLQLGAAYIFDKVLNEIVNNKCTFWLTFVLTQSILCTVTQSIIHTVHYVLPYFSTSKNQMPPSIVEGIFQTPKHRLMRMHKTKLPNSNTRHDSSRGMFLLGALMQWRLLDRH